MAFTPLLVRETLNVSIMCIEYIYTNVSNTIYLIVSILCTIKYIYTMSLFVKIEMGICTILSFTWLSNGKYYFSKESYVHNMLMWYSGNR